VEEVLAEAVLEVVAPGDRGKVDLRCAIYDVRFMPKAYGTIYDERLKKELLLNANLIYAEGPKGTPSEHPFGTILAAKLFDVGAHKGVKTNFVA
jgi:hypothetical protein